MVHCPMHNSEALDVASANVLDEFKLKAVIDWVSVRLRLNSPSQHRHVRNRLARVFGNIYVTACEDETSSRLFEFRVQNPLSADQFLQDVQAVRRPGDGLVTEADVEILGVEIALDCYLAGSNREQLARAATHLLRHHARPPSGPLRITEPGHFRTVATSRELFQAMLDGFSANTGWPGDDFRTRGYVKTTDGLPNARYAPLHQDEHRARFEATLMNGLSPFSSIASWRAFQFQQLSTRFAMCVSAAETDLEKELHARSPQLGRAQDAPRKRPSDRRQRRVATRRDIDLNERIRGALRALTTAQCCRNSVSSMAVKHSLSQGDTVPAVRRPEYLTVQHAHVPVPVVTVIDAVSNDLPEHAEHKRVLT